MGFLSFQLAALNRAHVQFAQLPPPVNTFLFKFSKIFRKPFEQMHHRRPKTCSNKIGRHERQLLPSWARSYKQKLQFIIKLIG